MKDLTGQRYGRLTVIKYTGTKDKWGSCIWECKCDCGNTVNVKAGKLRCGDTKSCGCWQKEARHLSHHPIKDISGQRFGKLIAIKPSGKTKKGTVWLCKCDCGNVVTVQQGELHSGRTQSCGCLRRKDISGQRFGRLVAIKPSGNTKQGTVWLCKCDCGNVVTVQQGSLHSGKTKSCGCLRKEGGFTPVHGGTRTRLYNIWCSMKRRCENPNVCSYPRYGGRGISVCEEWQDFINFRDWALTHGYDENAKYGECTLDRIDVDGNYEPSNCRWVDIATQNMNRRRHKEIIALAENNKVQCLPVKDYQCKKCGNNTFILYLGAKYKPNTKDIITLCCAKCGKMLKPANKEEQKLFENSDKQLSIFDLTEE